MLEINPHHRAGAAAADETDERLADWAHAAVRPGDARRRRPPRRSGGFRAPRQCTDAGTRGLMAATEASRACRRLAGCRSRATQSAVVDPGTRRTCARCRGRGQQDTSRSLTAILSAAAARDRCRAGRRVAPGRRGRRRVQRRSPRFSVDMRRLRAPREPLEMLDHFGGFDDQRHREVLRRVELVPVACVGECAQPSRTPARLSSAGQRRVRSSGPQVGQRVLRVRSDASAA